MKPISEFELHAMQARTARSRNPKAAAAKDEQALEKFAKGQERKLSALLCADLIRRGIPHIVARTDRKSGLPLGWPDVTAMCGVMTTNGLCSKSDGARVCCVELKCEGGILSPDQLRCHVDLRLAGVPVLVAYDLQTAIKFIKEHLCL